MVSQLRRSNPFAAECAMVYGAIRISGNFFDDAILDIDQDPAAAMAHPAVAFDNRIIPVGFDFFFYIRIFKFSHGMSPSKGSALANRFNQ